MIHVFERHPDLWSMVLFLFATHSPKSPVFYVRGKRAKPCAEGSRQGAAEAGIAASAAIQEPLESADEALATACEGFARADFDDTYLCGEPAAVAQALADFETAIALVGATLQRPKSAALRGAECELPGDFPVPLGVHKRAANGAVVGWHQGSPENPRLIQFQINHNFSVFSRPCASFRMSSLLVASIHTSSILVASICILASMHILSCSACLWFSAVTCRSHAVTA